MTSLNKGQRPYEVTEIFNYDLDGDQAKTLAKAELKLLTEEYLECEKEKKQIESVLFICEKEKEQIKSDLSHHKEGNLPKNIAGLFYLYQIKRHVFLSLHLSITF